MRWWGIGGESNGARQATDGDTETQARHVAQKKSDGHDRRGECVFFGWKDKEG